MSKRRMIDPAFWLSETISKLTLTQRLLFIGLFSNADDQGRLRGNPALIRNAVFPYDEIPLAQIKTDLEAIEKIGSIVIYTSENKDLIQIAGWWDYQKPQWAYPSDLPAPGGWHDRLRYRNNNEVCTYNWGGELDADTEPEPEQAEEPAPEAPNSNGSLPIALPKDLPKPPVLELVLELEPEIELKLHHEDDAQARKPVEFAQNSAEKSASEKWGRIQTTFQNNITFSISPLICDEMLSDDFFSLPETWWSEAITLAAGANKHTWNYVKGILDNSRRQNISPYQVRDKWQQNKNQTGAINDKIIPTPYNGQNGSRQPTGTAALLGEALRAKSRASGDRDKPALPLLQ